ncbi:Hypothetical_protein [Hexamita inflata]|uniref:Hypothetical_protein n=1 Tax=Hexamita inflata TaxID=28002 RepID=A0AA86R853_9EUKA|nr:Hypothetical protein HINF_LOCUS61159 [Hexamita inflata]
MNKQSMIVTSAQNAILKNKLDNIIREKNQLNEKLSESQELNQQLTHELTLKCTQVDQLIHNMKYAQLNKQQCETELKTQLLFTQNQINAFKSQNEAQQQQLDDLQFVLRLQYFQLQFQDVQEINSQPQCTAQLQSRALSPHSGELNEPYQNQNLTDQPVPVLPAKGIKKQYPTGLTNLKFTKYANKVLNKNANPEEICQVIEKEKSKLQFFIKMQTQSFGKFSMYKFQNYYKKIYAQALHKDTLTKDGKMIIFNESLKIRQEYAKKEQQINQLQIAQQIQKKYFADKDIFIYDIVQIVDITKKGK